MRISFTSLKVSIAGAKLSHLVKKNRAWDHGSMVEQARIIFQLVQKARSSGDVGTLKKSMTQQGFEKFKKEMEGVAMKRNEWAVKSRVIKEIAVVDVAAARQNHPDHFTALMKGVEMKVASPQGDASGHIFSEKWLFVRHGNWWILDEIKV